MEALNIVIGIGVGAIFYAGFWVGRKFPNKAKDAQNVGKVA